MSEREVLTVAETAEVLRINKMTAYKMTNNGTIPSIRIGDRILVPRVQLDKMLAGEKVEG